MKSLLSCLAMVGAALAVPHARAALDRAPSAILMCDEALRVTYANGLGEELLRDGYLTALHARQLALVKLESAVAADINGGAQ